MAITNEQLFAFIKKHPVSVVCVVVSLAALATFYFRLDKISLAEAELEQKTAEGERLAANVKYSAQLKEQLDELTAASKAIEGRMIRGSGTINLQYFYKLEIETGTKLVELTPVSSGAAKTPKPQFAPVGFNVGVEGTYPQILDFLRRLEHGSHFCRVLSATCGVAGNSSEAAGDAGPRLTLRLSLELLGLP